MTPCTELHGPSYLPVSSCWLQLAAARRQINQRCQITLQIIWSSAGRHKLTQFMQKVYSQSIFWIKAFPWESCFNLQKVAFCRQMVRWMKFRRQPNRVQSWAFFFFSFKRTEHLLRNVILGRCLWSRFNSPIWFISNWCHINSTHVQYGPLSRFGAGLKGTSALKVSPPCYQKNSGSVHTGAWTYTLWFSTHTLTDWATSSRNIKLINVQNSRSQNTFLPHSAFLGWHFRDKLPLWPMQTAIPSYLNFYIQHINGEWSACLRGFSCFCQIADSNKHSSNFCQNYLPVKMMDCPPQRLKSWKIKWNAFGLGCRSTGRININVLLL